MISQKTVLNTQTKINPWHEEWGGGGACLSIYFSAANRLIGEVVQSRRRLLLGASRRFQPGEGPSRGLFRDCTTGCGTDGSICGTI